MLLRAIEERVIVRVGETKPRNVRVRILAATHARLQEQVRLGPRGSPASSAAISTSSLIVAVVCEVAPKRFFTSIFSARRSVGGKTVDSTRTAPGSRVRAIHVLVGRVPRRVGAAGGHVGSQAVGVSDDSDLARIR